MKGRTILGGAGLLMLAAWMAWQDKGGPYAPAGVPGPAAVSAPPQAAAPGADGQLRPWLSALPETLQEQAPVPGWASLAEGREHGDSRAPPLHRPDVSRSGPTAAQLADPAAYRAYERSEHARTLAAFAAAAETKAAQLRADLVQARAVGIAPADILKVERKIQRLDEIRRGIVEHGKVVPR